jgi:hypothetical protein
MPVGLDCGTLRCGTRRRWWMECGYVLRHIASGLNGFAMATTSITVPSPSLTRSCEERGDRRGGGGLLLALVEKPIRKYNFQSVKNMSVKIMRVEAPLWYFSGCIKYTAGQNCRLTPQKKQSTSLPPPEHPAKPHPIP